MLRNVDAKVSSDNNAMFYLQTTLTSEKALC